MKRLIAFLAVVCVIESGVASALPPSTNLAMWFSATAPNYGYRYNQVTGDAWTAEGAWLNVGDSSTYFDGYTSMWSGHRLCSGWNPSWRANNYLGSTFTVLASVHTWGTGGGRLYHADYVQGGALLGYDGANERALFGWQGGGGVYYGPDGSWPINTDQIIEYHVTPGELNYYLNGELEWTESIGTCTDKTTHIYYAVMEVFSGACTDVLFYSDALSAGDLAAARQYLSEQSGVVFIPEPAALGLLGVGLLALRRRRS